MAFSKLLTTTAAALDRRFGWDRLPRPLGVVTLIGPPHPAARGEPLRHRHDRVGPAASERRRHLRTRTFDGSYNDLEEPSMGTSAPASAATSRSSSRIPEPLPQLLEPNPRLVSRELLTRDGVQAGDDRQRAGGRLDPVRGARLVQPRQERGGGAVRARARRGRRLARAADAHPAHAPATPAIPATARRRPTSPPTRTGGTARRSTAATRRSPHASARTRAAS